MDINSSLDLARVAKTVDLRLEQVKTTVELLDAGNTVPFITRYRKDQTGGLDEEQIRGIEAEVAKGRQLLERKQTILRSIHAQGKLTPELAKSIEAADSIKWLEDLYLPFKPKKQTRATLARERGLGPLAEEILAAAPACENLDARAADFINPDREVLTAADALLGAGHILAENFSERADLRQRVRKIFRRTGKLVSSSAEKEKPDVAKPEGEVKEKEKGKGKDKKGKGFRDYFEFSEALAKVPPHRVLAINRGEKAKALRIKIDADIEAINAAADELLVPADHSHQEFLRGCARDALARLVIPSLEREVRREMTEKAEAHAVDVFARNLRNLLLQPPVRNRRLLAVDPGFKSGCKLVALDEFGSLLANEVVHLVGSEERKGQARQKLIDTITAHKLSVVAIGNGTACRETEELLADLIATDLKDSGVSYVVVNEAGASVYSASPLGREELPEYDATVRGAVSIGRRLQDPLSELVKIDPANIGVGLYQHDVKAKHLQSSLDAVVESCVNYVGVDLNSASPALLRYVSGLNGLTARRLYDYRVEHGPFRNREQLHDVPGFGEATFVQAAGFLKIRGSDNPLDATWIHPESYDVATQVMTRLECELDDLKEGKPSEKLATGLKSLDAAALAGELNAGDLLLKDIIASLSRPGRDPREDLPPPIFRKGVVKLEDLEKDMELTGTVLNVVDFGAFVDIGLSDSGLVHISQIADKYVKDAHEVVAVGDVVNVWVLEVDKERRRVSLSMIAPDARQLAQERRSAPPHKDKAQAAEGGAGSQTRRDSGQSRRGNKDRGGAGTGGNAGGRGHSGGGKPSYGKGGGKGKQNFSKQHAPKPKPKPLKPITEAMAKGAEPMRTFGDLIQFYEKKKGPEEEKNEPEKKS
jgi:uncharacterized protein